MVSCLKCKNCVISEEYKSEHPIFICWLDYYTMDLETTLNGDCDFYEPLDVNNAENDCDQA